MGRIRIAVLACVCACVVSACGGEVGVRACAAEVLHEHAVGDVLFYTLHEPEEWMRGGELDIDRMCRDLTGVCVQRVSKNEISGQTPTSSLTLVAIDDEIVGFALSYDLGGCGHFAICRCSGGGDAISLRGEMRISRELCSALIYAAECSPVLLDACFEPFQADNSGAIEVFSGTYETTIGQMESLPLHLREAF